MFLEHMGEILSREKINSFLPARKRSGVRNIDTHIKSIRKALGEQELIQCVRSVGYWTETGMPKKAAGLLFVRSSFVSSACGDPDRR